MCVMSGSLDRLRVAGGREMWRSECQIRLAKGLVLQSFCILVLASCVLRT